MGSDGAAPGFQFGTDLVHALFRQEVARHDVEGDEQPDDRDDLQVDADQEQRILALHLQLGVEAGEHQHRAGGAVAEGEAVLGNPGTAGGERTLEALAAASDRKYGSSFGT